MLPEPHAPPPAGPQDTSTDPPAWSQVDEFLSDTFALSDPALEDALRASHEAGLPSIQVSPVQGRLLHLLARSLRARRILEVGTLGGYSSIWLARALSKQGRLVSLELEPRHAEVARANLARAGLTDRVEIRVGRATESLAQLVAEGAGPFDLIFIDADKESYPEYLTWAVRLSRPGTLLIADNVIRQGAVANPADADPRVQGVRRFLQQLAVEPGVTGVAVQMVGSKGYDGWAVARVARRSKPRRAPAAPSPAPATPPT
jgi:predicted O-methyltransferase YrrM